MITFIIFMLDKFGQHVDYDDDYDDEFDDDIILTEDVCFVNIDKPAVTWTFFLGPLAFLVTVNLSLFVATIFQIQRTRSQTQYAVNSSSNSNSSVNSLKR